jgi:hypothetical protein
VGATGRIQALVINHQAFDRFSSNEVRLNDLLNIVERDSPIPDGFRVNHNVWAVFALVKAARLVRSHLAVEPTLSQFPFEQFLQLCLAVRIAGWAWLSRQPLIAADEYMLLKFGHEYNLQQGKCGISRRN